MKDSKNTLNALSFFALMIIAFLLLIERFLPIIGITIGGSFIGILDTIKDLFVLIVIGISAFNFAKNGKKNVKILFWVAVVVYIVATILFWI